MADFGLTVKITEGTNDGPPVPGAKASGVTGHYIDKNTTVPAVSDDEGNAVLDGLMLHVEAPGFGDYDGNYHRPSLQAPVPVSLQRSA